MFSYSCGKVKVAILGSGNIGMDLMYKIKRNPYLELTLLAGIDPASHGLKLAREEGVAITVRGIKEIIENPHCCDIVFDATSAYAHLQHAPLLMQMGKVAIDLTPSGIGEKVVPVVNLDKNLHQKNVCLITCGGQAVIPVIWAISRISKVKYAEIVSSISSLSAGPGTRQNIDEFTETTALGIVEVGRAGRGKAIMILNPAEPPVMMANTIYCLVEKPDEAAISQAVMEMVEKVGMYVPGYKLKSTPVFDGEKVTILMEVTGAGDYLPKHAGNLDIMTSAAVATAEGFAKNILGKDD